jgi:hypothetical protein
MVWRTGVRVEMISFNGEESVRGRSDGGGEDGKSVVITKVSAYRVSTAFGII